MGDETELVQAGRYRKVRSAKQRDARRRRDCLNLPRSSGGYADWLPEFDTAFRNMQNAASNQFASGKGVIDDEHADAAVVEGGFHVMGWSLGTS